MERSRTLGALTVAEGIETPEQLAFLRAVGCDLIQGCIYAKPLPVPAVEAPRGDRMPGRIFRETNGLTAGRNRSYNKNEQNTVANPPKGGDAKLKGLYG